jgi:hypothetical protein
LASLLVASFLLLYNNNTNKKKKKKKKKQSWWEEGKVSKRNELQKGGRNSEANIVTVLEILQ